jgi:shikimate kinase
VTVTLLEQADPRLRDALSAEFTRRRGERLDGIPRGVTVVLAGHRAAGKTTLLPHVARALGREGLDLDTELARRSGRSLREWIVADERGFRDAERALFAELPRGLVVSVGGGFLSLHTSALKGCVVVEVPISFATYAERLHADTTRPRLRPELPVEEELSEVYAERTERHAAARPMSLVEFALRLERGSRARRVVTLPPGAALEPFAWAARHAGAELLEVRSDLHPPELDLLAASRALPILIAQRTPKPLPAAWVKVAELIDTEPPLPPAGEGRGEGRVFSHHSPRSLATLEALEHWSPFSVGTHIKHVEPLGAPSRFPEILETQRALQARFGIERVTVLVTGAHALPFRAVLAQKNALDYLAFDSAWAAAPGQRLLADTVRESKHPRRERLGILGSGIMHSRSPRIHAQPFDRIDWPADTSLNELLDALRPHYRGFAVTNPFKKSVAAYAGAKLSAVNTLIRDRNVWRSQNTDVIGARAVLEKLGAKSLTVLGDGGVTVALRETGAELKVVTRAMINSEPVSGVVVWTWPANVETPTELRFENARVAVISYGAPGRKVAADIRARGGTPVMLGARWFIAQARRQKELWESAS